MQVRELLETAIPILYEAHRYTANNIANIDTPGFVPEQVDFAASLRAALSGRSTVELRRTDTRHVASDAGLRGLTVTPSHLAPPRNDGNRVSLDYELTQLARNRHETYVQMLNNQNRLLREVLRAQ